MKSTTTLTFCATALLAITFTTSCKEKGEVVHTKAEKTPPPSTMPTSAMPSSMGGKTGMANMPTTPSGKVTSPSKYTWTLPEGWTDKPASGMRLGTIIIPATSEGGKELSGGIFEFGGDLIGNVNRWRQQIALPEASESDILPTLKPFDTPLGKDGKGYTMLLINPATPEKAMLAAIIQRPAGTSVFVKVTGSVDALKAVQTPFLTFIQSLK